jgi:hypothetical protein
MSTSYVNWIPEVIGKVVSFNHNGTTFVGVIHEVMDRTSLAEPTRFRVVVPGHWNFFVSECFDWQGPIPASGLAKDAVNAAPVERGARKAPMTVLEAQQLVAEHVARLRQDDSDSRLAEALDTLTDRAGHDRSPALAHFAVVGAGEVEIGIHDHSRCGEAVGVAIGVSWGRHHYAGGVMDNAEVDRLIGHLRTIRGPGPLQDLRACSVGFAPSLMTRIAGHILREESASGGLVVPDLIGDIVAAETARPSLGPQPKDATLIEVIEERDGRHTVVDQTVIPHAPKAQPAQEAEKWTPGRKWL